MVTENWRNTHTHVYCTHSPTHCTSIQLQPHCAKRHPSYYITLESDFYFEATRWGRRRKPDYPQKNHDSLPANRYNRYNILEDNIQRPGRELNHHPPIFVISSPPGGQKRSPRLIHWATDRPSLPLDLKIANVSFSPTLQWWPWKWANVTKSEWTRRTRHRIS